MYLPQVGLRLGNKIITDMDDGGTPNQVGYPFSENGFEVVGVPEESYGPFLGHRIDNGIPSWAERDSAMALAVLGGSRLPLASSRVVIDEARFRYLKSHHGGSVELSGIDSVTGEDLAEAIRRKFANGLVYNLRFVRGERAGTPVRELDALMYSVQVEFQAAGGDVKRFQVGLKYQSETHTSEIVTFF
jgi:hypothetical protein